MNAYRLQSHAGPYGPSITPVGWLRDRARARRARSRRDRSRAHVRRSPRSCAVVASFGDFGCVLPGMPRVLPNPRCVRFPAGLGRRTRRPRTRFTASDGSSASGRRASSAVDDVEPDRLRRTDQRGRHERTGHAGRRPADQRGEHRRRRCEMHGAADDRRLDDVVLELLVRRGRSPSAITPLSGLALKASSTKNEPPRNPPICGMRFVIAAQMPASGASGMPRMSPDGQDHRAVQQRDRDRAGEVPGDRAVHDAPDVVGPLAACRWHEPAAAAHERVAVEQHRDRRDEDEQRRARARRGAGRPTR